VSSEASNVLTVLISSLLVASPAIAIHIEESDLAIDEAHQFAAWLQDAITARVGIKPSIDDPSSCGAEDRCVPEIRERTGAQDLVMLRLVGGLTRVRVVADRIVSSTAAPARTAVSAEIELARTSEGWPAGAAQIAQRLFAKGSLPPLEPLTLAPPPAGRASVLPWVMFGASAAALAVGVGFGFASNGPRDMLEAGPVENHAPLEQQLRQRATAATVSYVVSGALAATGALFLVF
jgi:hypothetical protein